MPTASRFSFGEVILVVYPFTDQSGSKVRPALVVSADKFNTGEDIVIVPISSAPEASDPHVLPFEKSHAAFAGSGLVRDSYIKWTKPTPISRQVVRRRLGTIPAGDMRPICERIISLFG